MLASSRNKYTIQFYMLQTPEHVGYGFSKSRLIVRLPQGQFTELLSTEEDTRVALLYAKAHRVLTYYETGQDDRIGLRVNAQQAGLLPPPQRSEVLSAAAYVLDGVMRTIPDDKHDPSLRMRLPGVIAEPVSLTASVVVSPRWFTLRAQRATRRMQGMAEALRVAKPDVVETQLYLDGGLHMTLGDKGQHVETVGFSDDGQTLQVEGVSLNNPTQLFIAMAGLVSVAHDKVSLADTVNPVRIAPQTN